MKLRVLQENLSKALSITSRFVSTKAQLPVLSNVLLQTTKSKLTISATNLENSISISIGGKVDKEGKITVPSRVISDLVSNLSVGQLDLESEKEKLKITTSSFKSTISGMNASEFPEIPTQVSKNALQFSAVDFLGALSKILFAVSADETRPVLSGVLILFGESAITLVSTDGFRLSQKKLKLESKAKIGNLKLILPKNILSELSRIDGEENLSFSFSKSDNQVVFSVSDAVLSSRIIEGEFPDFEKIIPSESKIVVDVDKEEFLRSVKLASVFARDAANVVKMKVEEDQILLSAESQSAGKQESSLDAKVESDDIDDFVIAFNYRFLEEFLNSCEGDNVKIKLSDPNAPSVFLDSKDKDYLHIVMPVKL